VRQWGRIGARRGNELAEDFATEQEAAEALIRLATLKRRRGYRDL
jgi:predicted DNA-binding WGR domain protein